MKDMTFKYVPEGDVFIASWGDVALYFEKVQRTGRHLWAQAYIENDYATILAPSVIDILDARSRRSIASAILDDSPDWPARIEDAASTLEEEVSANVRSSLQIVAVEDIDNLPDLDFVIGGVLQRPGIAALIGNWGTGKTFTLLDMAACIGAGIAWHGFPVQQGPVLYVYSEGIGGIKKRKAAWEESNRTTMQNIRFIPHAVPLLDAAAVESLISAALEKEPPVAIFVDPLARAMAGHNENATEDMGNLIEAADHIKRETGATVIFGHHTNKLGDFRGNTAFMAGMDNAILLDRKNDALTLHCEKSKDVDPFDDIRLVMVHYADSIALETETHETRIRRMQNNLTPTAHELLDTLTKNPEGLRYNEWITASGMSKGRAFSTAHNELKEAHLVENQLGRWVSLRPNMPVVPVVPNGSGNCGTVVVPVVPHPVGVEPGTVPALVTTLGTENGSTPKCQDCGLYADPRFPHASCAQGVTP